MNSHHYSYVRSQYVSFFVLLFCFSLNVIAQPQLAFDSISVALPQVTLHFKVGCSIVPKQINFKVKEDGKLVNNFSLFYADTTRQHCCLSTALVIDRSGSMNGQSIDGAKAGAKVFVDAMDGACDEATLVSFRETVTLDVFMTDDKVLLANGINGLSANGGTAVWDAAIVGIQQLVNNATQPCRGVILLTDGEDNASNNSVNDVISLASANHIPVYTIGLGTGINDADLSLIASSTGGTYTKAPSASDLVYIFRGLYTLISRASVVGEITYTTTTKCLDGSTRTVDLTVDAAVGCPGTITKTKTYKMPLDSSTFQTATIDIGTVTAMPGGFVKIPLSLLTDIIDPLDASVQFTIEFDDACIQMLNISTAGFKLDGVSIDATPISGGYLFGTTKKILGPIDAGILAMFGFHVSSGLSDRECPITLKAWIFSNGCIKPILISGKIIVRNFSLNVMAPNGGEIWCAGSRQNIQWTSKYISLVQIFLLDDSGLFLPYLITDSYDATLGYFDWFIPANLPTGKKYRIQIRDVNATGFVSTSAQTFTIIALPIIFAQPRDTTICAGNTAHFSIKADSSSITSVQWQVKLNGDSLFRDLSGENTFDLVRNNVQYSENNSLYRTHLSTSCSSVYSDSAMLTVNPAPAILSQPQGQDVCLGSSATFSVSVSGTNILYQWRKDGIPINYATSSSYSISSITQNDLGNYDVTIFATCSFTSITSAVAQLRTAPLPQIISQPKGDTVCVGKSVTFLVSATGKGLKYQWRKNGSPITGATSPTFTLLSVLNSDNGLYDVDITDTCGLTHIASNPALLTVNSTPIISAQPSNQNICEGSTASFTITANPVSSYQWLKNGIAIPGATSNQFVITNAQIADTGSYAVRLINSCGQIVSTTAYLSVVKTTAISLQPVSQTVNENGIVTFTVNAVGANLTYQWRKNGIDISGATNSSYTISPARKIDEGNYTVVVSGQCGQAVQSNIAMLSVTLVDVKQTSSPTSFYLGQNYPNPFTDYTTITLTRPSVTLSQWERVGVRVYDIFGRDVLDLSNKIIENGKVTIENSQLPSAGIYFYRLTIGNESQTKMMTLIK